MSCRIKWIAKPFGSWNKGSWIVLHNQRITMTRKILENPICCYNEYIRERKKEKEEKYQIQILLQSFFTSSKTQEQENNNGLQIMIY